MKTPRTCNLLAAALATALLSPVALAQSDNAANKDATQQVQEVPRPALPPAVTQRLPVDGDPRTPVTDADAQRLEEPMSSTPADSRAAAPSAVAQRNVWAELDADGDGRISAAEANADTEFNTHFAMMDSDSDGYISDAEFGAHARTMQGEGAQGIADVPPPPPAQSQGAANAAAHSSVVQRELWSRLDTDGDGRISSVEASMDSEFSSHFGIADADSDGFVTDVEFRESARNLQHYGDANIDQDDGVYDDEPEPTEEDPTLDERDDR